MAGRAKEANRAEGVKILIAGYHGFGNCGDEAILLAMKNNIERLYGGASLSVLSFKPAETEKTYGIESVNRFNALHVLRAIHRSDILISGGGSLLQDETSLRSLMYYLTIIFTAKLLGKRVMLYSNGIGPVSMGISKVLIRLVVNRVDLITLREEASLLELERLGVNRPPVYVTADPAFTLDGAGEARVSEILETEGIPSDKPIIGVSMRPWGNQEGFITDMAAVCDYMACKHNATILFIPMQRIPDTKVSYEIMSKMKNKSYILRNNYGSGEILGIIGKLSIIISMRLHSLVFAGVANVPMLGFVYDPKVRSFLELTDMPEAGGIGPIDMEAVSFLIDGLIENNAAYRKGLKARTDALKEKAKMNDTLLEALLEPEAIGVILDDK